MPRLAVTHVSCCPPTVQGSGTNSSTSTSKEALGSGAPPARSLSSLRATPPFRPMPVMEEREVGEVGVGCGCTGHGMAAADGAGLQAVGQP